LRIALEIESSMSHVPQYVQPSRLRRCFYGVIWQYLLVLIEEQDENHHKEWLWL